MIKNIALRRDLCDVKNRLVKCSNKRCRLTFVEVATNKYLREVYESYNDWLDAQIDCPACGRVAKPYNNYIIVKRAYRTNKMKKSNQSIYEICNKNKTNKNISIKNII